MAAAVLIAAGLIFSENVYAASIHIQSPENATYPSKNISLNFSADGALFSCLLSVDDTANQTLDNCQNLSVISREYSQVNSTFLWYHLNENQGTKIIDAANIMNGTIVNNVAWSSGKFGSGAGFNGTGYINVPNSEAFNLTNQITIESWIKPVIGTRNCIVAKYIYSGADARSYELDVNASGNVQFALSLDGIYANTTWFASVGVIPANKWTHVTATSDGVTMTIYINGQEDYNTAPAPASIYNTDRNITIGAWLNEGCYFNGTIDEVRLLNRSLTAEEVQSDYLLGLGSHSATVYANDTAGNWNSTTKYFTIALTDVTPPTITIISPMNTSYGAKSIWFNVTLNETGSWAGYSLDGAANVTMSNSSGNWNALNTSMADGPHYIRFFANDTGGNMNSTGVYFTVNKTFFPGQHSLVLTVASSGISFTVNETKKYAASNLPNATTMAVIARSSLNSIRGASTASVIVNQSFENNNFYLVFTKGVWQNMEGRVALLGTRTFEAHTNPTFGYPLKTGYTAHAGLDYSKKGINIIGDMQLAPGIYIFSVENMGFRNKKPIINVTRQ